MQHFTSCTCFSGIPESLGFPFLLECRQITESSLCFSYIQTTEPHTRDAKCPSVNQLVTIISCDLNQTRQQSLENYQLHTNFTRHQLADNTHISPDIQYIVQYASWQRELCCKKQMLVAQKPRMLYSNLIIQINMLLSCILKNPNPQNACLQTDIQLHCREWTFKGNSRCYYCLLSCA